LKSTSRWKSDLSNGRLIQVSRDGGKSSIFLGTDAKSTVTIMHYGLIPCHTTIWL
jgi:hypothetical protein